ncbi:MAG: hypothetical protein JOZ22_18830 [Acidobacteriia bacterium]|nr:hypothetical protein [Terriglobia bacterium]
MFQHFAEEESALDPLFTITASHPVSSERKARIEEEMRAFPPHPGLKLDSENFRKAQAKLKKLTPPVIQQKLFGQ